MKNKWTIFILLFLAVVNITALATLAYNRWFNPVFPQEEKEFESSQPVLQKALELEHTQCLHMGKCKMMFVQEADIIRKQMKEKKVQLIEEMRTDEPSLGKMDILIDEIMHMEGEIQKMAVRRILEDKTILTPLQQEKFLDIFEHHVGKASNNCYLDSDVR